LAKEASLTTKSIADVKNVSLIVIPRAIGCQDGLGHGMPYLKALTLL